MSVGSIVAGGFRLVRTQPQLIAIWAVLYIIGAAVAMVAMRPFTGAVLLFQQEAAARAAAGVRTPPAFPPDAIGLFVVMELAFAVLIAVAFAAVVRAVTQPGGDRFAYLRLGMDELRLLGLGVLFAIVGFVAELVAIVLLALVVVAVGYLLGQGFAAAVGVVLGIGLLLAVIWAEVRLSLAGAYTVMRRRIVIGPAWRATRGRFWTLFGAYLVLTLGFMVVGVAMIAITSPGLLAAYASLDQRAINAAAQAQMARQAGGVSFAMALQMIVGGFVGVAMGAVTFGAVATAAVELSEEGVTPTLA